MLWKFIRRGITIPAELHQKLLTTCKNIDENQGEIVAVRSIKCPRPSNIDKQHAKSN